jgi:nitrogen-specific signal transduction histidine kinase
MLDGIARARRSASRRTGRGVEEMARRLAHEVKNPSPRSVSRSRT